MYPVNVGICYSDLTYLHRVLKGFAQPFDLSAVEGVLPGSSGGRCEAFFIPSFSDRDGIVQLRYSVETGDHEVESLPEAGISPTIMPALVMSLTDNPKHPVGVGVVSLRNVGKAEEQPARSNRDRHKPRGMVGGGELCPEGNEE